MLIRFRVSNYLSFKDEVEFSMIPGKVQQHKNHIVKGGGSRNDINILRTAVFYGGNASGKSNLVKAINFAQSLIIEGVKLKQTIPVKPFKLDRSCAEQPSKFEFEIRSHDRNYLYGFKVDPLRIQTEWLYEQKKTTESLIFERETSIDGKTIVKFGSLKLANKEERNFLHFVAKGTRPNQLFLSESIERNIRHFEDIYEWFDNVLRIVFPESRYYIKLDEQTEEIKSIIKYLEIFDTGVCGFSLQNVPLETEIPSKVIDNITKDLKADQSLSLIDTESSQRYWIKKTVQQEPEIYKLMLKHKMIDCEETALFETDDESDGTVRLLDLIPILTLPLEKTRVFIVDELDRSLHPILCYQEIDRFLNLSGNSQLIVTTHESALLTFDLLRRDEIWFIEKDQKGASRIYSLEEFNPRYDKDIKKGYLLGRFGAIPILGKKNF